MRNSASNTEKAFAAWTSRLPEQSAECLRLLAVTPLETADFLLARAVLRHGGAVAVDLGRDAEKWPAIIAEVSRQANPRLGIRIPDHAPVSADMLPADVGFLMLSSDVNLLAFTSRFPVIAEVCSVEEADLALATGVAGLITRGQECGGRIGDESSFILLQRVLKLTEKNRIPVWAQGGMGLHTAAAAVAGGAFGVVLESQLALLNESSLPDDIRQALLNMDGSETRLIGGYQVFSRPGTAAAASAELSADEVRRRLGARSLQDLVPAGQDAALARLVAAQYSNVESVLHGYRMSIAGHLHQARTLQPLAENSPLARAHGTRYPIAQGPMTRVSDTAEFAVAVAENGALPFLALSLMTASACRELIESTRRQIGDKPWGIGVLGFAPPEVLNPQLELIREHKPSLLLLAGGRPSQARPFVEMGIPTYLHVPSPGLLELFIKDGARHFVFEGRECGGHVGPRFSFVLWEQQMDALLRVEHAEELHVLFAGGIHDERSAAMVAAMAAPLAARGAKIGVLMGTAYVATEESVRCNAVIDTFQEQSLAGRRTALVETAPGHAIRCLPSAFVDYFNAEKIRLQQQGLDQQEIWKRLEDLNIGRLRVASKGVERRGDALVTVSTNQQLDDGMYMIGQLIAMHEHVQSMASLHDKVSRGATALLQACSVPVLPRSAQAEAIAVVGMACIYPGSPDLESYWTNILAGRDLVTEVPAERWNAGLYYQDGEAAPGKSVSKWGGFIDPVAFDPLQYGIPPQSLAAIEPVQLLSLEVARRALQDAGYDNGDNARRFDREKTSVIFGAESGTDLANAYAFRNLYTQYLGRMPAELDAALPQLTEDSFPGILVNVIAGRIANRLGLGGVNYSVDSACASSLTAVELSVKELRSGSSDMVLAGGADFHNSINDFMMFTSVGALSAKGRCRSFDSHADGICLGEGVGVVVLKRLADAERDGDRIYAVIDGVAGSSDGKGLGLTAPRKEGQKRALERAYWQAGLLPADVGLVEAHGTGTVVGDRTEMQTLSEIYNAGGAVMSQAALGSVKSQIGHTKCAAGIAGLIKVSKALHHRVLAPTALITQPNEGYRGGRSPFMLNRQARPWQGHAHAAVSAFGFGGANFHAVLSAHEGHKPEAGLHEWPVELFLLRGESRDIARQTANRLAGFLQKAEATLSLRDLAFTAGQAASGPVQYALLAASPAELLARLQALLDGRDDKQVQVRNSTKNESGKLAFVFPGQGSQYPGMMADLFVAFPWLNELLALATPAQRATLFPATAYSDAEQQAQQAALTDTRAAQPALGLVEMAAAQLLARLGIRPDMAAGHSYGELVALASAGALSAQDLLQLSTRRGEVILAATGRDPGKMAAVSMGARELGPLLSALPAVVLANQNSPVQTVISGPSAEVDKALLLLRQHNVGAREIDTACAFHSPVVAGAEAAFAEELARADFQATQWPVYSNVDITAHATAAGMRASLARHVVSPVRFLEEIERMHDDGARIFVEVGPKRVLAGCIKKILGERPHTVVTLDDGRSENLAGLASFLQAIAQLAVQVDNIDSALLFAGRSRKLLDLDSAATYSRSIWMVNGARAWPRQGTLPAHAGHVVMAPLTVAASAAATAAPLSSTADTAVIHYLDNMREAVRAQRDVLLGLLGAPAAAASTARPVMAERVIAAPAPASVVATVAAAKINTVIAATPAAVTGSDVRGTLISIVSERTGYPADMLDLDLDLEADLSIDSIKRMEIIGELSERLAFRALLGADADALLEQLAAHKNLRSMMDWLDSRLPATTATPVAAIAAVTETAKAGAPAQDISAVLLGIVSSRTGYPEEVLEPDLDLEADLSIDSIKRLEIVGELSSRLGFDSLLADKDKALEALAALKTLRAMGDWLQSHVGGKTASPAVHAELVEEDIDPLSLARYVLRTVPAPRVVAGENRFHGKRFLITDDSLGVASTLASMMEAHGAVVHLLNFSEAEPLPPHPEEVDGLIHLWSLNPANRVRDVKRFFSLIRETIPHKTKCLLVASGLGGNFGCYRADGSVLSADFGQGAGLAGMIKSLAKEFPDIRAHWVDLDLSEPAADLAACLEMELLSEENDLTEVAYQTGERRCLQIVRTELSLIQDIDNLELDEKSVVLLTGGARGITARIATALARRFHCHFELVGRSAAPESAEEAENTRHAHERKSLRQAVIAANPGMRPAEVEKVCSQIQAERDMRDTFAQIHAAGGTVNYTQMDVRDIDAFTGLIQSLYARHGRIDGVVHGAGIVEDKLTRHKTSESFQRVFDTKVRGALMLYKLIRDDVKFVVFFSSVAGAFGNRGQVDYASANDVLDKLAHALQARVKGRVLSVNWGPWADTGMVSAELEREYARKGIGLIPLQQGVDALLRELSFGRKEDTQVVLMCGTPDSFGAGGPQRRTG